MCDHCAFMRLRGKETCPLCEGFKMCPLCGILCRISWDYGTFLTRLRMMAVPPTEDK